MSAKKRKEIEETREIRAIVPGELCECCRHTEAVETHEIAAGSHARSKAVYVRLAQMRLCRDCHRYLQGRPYAEQVAAKMLAIIDAVNYCCGRKAFDKDDVIEALK